MSARFDWVLLSATILLVTIGLIVLHAIEIRDPDMIEGLSLVRQLTAAGIGFGLLVAVARMDYRTWIRAAPLWYLASVLLLIVLLVAGEVVAGATRSIDLGVFQFQPTEIAKLGVILLLARWYTAHARELGHPWYVFVSLLIVGIPAGMVVLQPDIGSAALFGAIWLAVTLASHVRTSYVAVLIGVMLVSAPLLVGQLQPYQQERIQTFFNPTADPRGAGYNVDQATVAVGSGQIFGRGLGGGTQSQLNFLPSQHTDFIFAVIGEKLGLVGSILVIGLFGVFLWRGFSIALGAKDTFGSLIATGITSLFLVQTGIVIAMNLGLAPVTGLPLPFISYGGTSLITSLFAVGLLQSIATHRQDLQFRE